MLNFQGVSTKAPKLPGPLEKDPKHHPRLPISFVFFGFPLGFPEMWKPPTEKAPGSWLKLNVWQPWCPTDWRSRRPKLHPIASLEEWINETAEASVIQSVLRKVGSNARRPGKKKTLCFQPQFPMYVSGTLPPIHGRFLFAPLQDERL